MQYAGEEALRADKRIKHTVIRPGGLTNDAAGTAKLILSMPLSYSNLHWIIKGSSI